MGEGDGWVWSTALYSKCTPCHGTGRHADKLDADSTGGTQWHDHTGNLKNDYQSSDMDKINALEARLQTDSIPVKYLDWTIKKVLQYANNIDSIKLNKFGSYIPD